MLKEKLLQRDDNALEVLGALSDVVADFAHVDVVKRCIHFVQHEEGCLAEAMDAEEQGEGSDCLLAT